MILTITAKEIEAILLQHAETVLPGRFNTVSIDNSYSSIRGAIFSFEEPEPKGTEDR